MIGHVEKSGGMVAIIGQFGCSGGGARSGSIVIVVIGHVGNSGTGFMVAVIGHVGRSSGGTGSDGVIISVIGHVGGGIGGGVGSGGVIRHDRQV